MVQKTGRWDTHAMSVAVWGASALQITLATAGVTPIGAAPLPADARPGRRRCLRRRDVPRARPRSRADGAPLRRRPQRRRGPGAGGVHPAGPVRRPDRGSSQGGRLPALDRAQPGARPQPTRPGLAPPPAPERRREASVEDTVVLAEEHRRVVDALRVLPPRQRDCLILRYYDELGIDEIASRRSGSHGTR